MSYSSAPSGCTSRTLHFREDFRSVLSRRADSCDEGVLFNKQKSHFKMITLDYLTTLLATLKNTATEVLLANHGYSFARN